MNKLNSLIVELFELGKDIITELGDDLYIQMKKVSYYARFIAGPKVIWISAQLAIFLLTLAQKALAVLYVLQETTIKGAVCVIVFCFILDVISRVKLRIQASRQTLLTPVIGNEEPPQENFRPVYLPGFELTFVDRGFAFLSYSWPTAFLFIYFPEVVERMHPLLLTFNHEYLRGLVIMFSSAKFLPIMTLFSIFHGIVRRRGKDTIWLGNIYYKPWYKHFIRYHWCYSLMNCIIIYFTLTIYVKTERSHQMTFDEFLIFGDALFYISMTLIIYGAICAALGRQPRIPLFHRACIFHCGQLKNDPEEFKDLY